ncbi:MAG: N-acetyl-gamma-glutamyl-phosphate reductase [Spongiibacteraceae bacterium]|nr:N-acetyl-gamma-glutamyl-phosphate reductase [Spongiibacteraceae bacterium]
MIKVGIVGGTGYTGVELLRMLARHPQVQVVAITSRAEEGLRVDELYPSLRGSFDIRFSHPDINVLEQCDVVFFATPHNVAMNMVPQLRQLNTPIVDLSADFRLRDAKLWSQWYGEPHACPDVIPDAVYGLPELNREQISRAQLVACPGCYPTSVQLGFLPLLEQGLINEQTLIANAVSGVSGAGRQAKVDNLFAETSDSFQAYAVSGHRHLPEIEQGLNDIVNSARPNESKRNPLQLTFVPHLVPMVRGMHSTLYAQLHDSAVTLEEVQGLFEERYADEPFVDVLPAGSHPQTRSVRGANICRLSIHQPQGKNTLVVLSVIDNLVKGASGQAIQNMNIMMGLDECAGLDTIALMP